MEMVVIKMEEEQKMNHEETMMKVMNKRRLVNKVKQSRYRPGVAQRVRGN